MSNLPTDPAHSTAEPNKLMATGAVTDSTGLHSGDSEDDSTDSPPSFHPPTRPGDIGHLGRYRILKPLGKGGMGAVFLGFDDVLQRKIALKVLSPRFASNKVARERFLREARTAASVSSPHVVSIIDVGEDLGIPYIAMEYLQGIPLDRYLTNYSKLSLRQVLRIGQEVARGLAAAHAAGLVHRDIKPANLWLEAPHGRVKILDFGLAKETESQGGSDVTQAGQVVGTPAFMSPEQARGDAVDARTDLFCLGIVLYRLCTGQQPFTGPTAMSVLLSVGIDEPLPVRQLNPAVPESLATLIYQLLRKKPAERPQTATEVHAALVSIEDGRRQSVPEATAVTSNSEYIPIPVAAQGDRVWEQFNGPSTISADAEEATPRKLAIRASFPWRIVGGVLAALSATLAIVAVLFYTSRARDERYADPELSRPTPVSPVVVKSDPDRKVAEWVLSLPGNPEVELAGGVVIRPPTRLPSAPFKVRRITVSHENVVTDADLNLLRDLTGLEGIVFARTTITDLGIEKLSRFGSAAFLTELSLGTEELTDNAMQHYAAFRSLRIVSLTGPYITHQGIKTLQQHCPMLTSLVIDRVQVRDIDLAPFCLLRWFLKLEHLGISSPPVTPFGIGFLSTWHNLKSLQLSGVAVNDAHADAVARIPSLTLVVLRQTSVSDAGLEKFGKLNGLRRLSISGCPKITNVGITKLKVLLPACVIEFDNAAPKQDVDRVVATWVLSKRGGHISLHGQAGPVMSLERLPQCPLSINSFDLASTTFVLSDDDIELFAPLTSVTGVRLSRSTITDAGLKKWSETPAAARYLWLILNSTELTNAGLAHLKAFQSLSSLGLAGAKITDAGVKTLTALPTLTSLDLSRTGITDEGLMTLSSLRTLRTLTLKETKVTPEGVRKLSRLLPGCKIICDFLVSANPPLDPAWVVAVEKMPPASQVQAVIDELVRRNPRFTGKATHTITPTGVDAFQVQSDAITDIGPVAVLKSLTRLHCTGDERGVGLLTDITPLAGLSLLRDVSLAKNRSLLDVSALKDKPLTRLNLGFTGIADLSFISGMPLTTLHLNPNVLRDLSSILKCAELEELFLDFGIGPLPGNQIEQLRAHPKLRFIEGIPVATFWPAWDRRKDPSRLLGPLKVIVTQQQRDARSISFDADGRRIVSNGFNGSVQIWDVKSGDKLDQFELKQFGQAAEFITGTDLVAASYSDGVRFWNLKTKSLDGERLPPQELFCGLAVSFDGKTLVGHTSTPRKPIKRYTIATRQPLPDLEGHTGPVHHSAFSRNNKQLITSSTWPDGSVRIWDLDSAKEVYRQDRSWIDLVVSVGFSPDDRFAMYSTGRSAIELIDWKSKKTEKRLHWFPIGGATFSANGKYIILGGTTGVLTVLDLSTGEVVAEGNGGARIGRVIVSNDGKTIATSHSDGNIRLWDWSALCGKKP